MKKPITEIELFNEFEAIINQGKKDNVHFVDKTMDVAHYILSLLEKKGMKQKDLAILLGKKEAEISKWMGGMHNFTLRTIASIEIALHEQIVIIPNTTHIYSPSNMVNNTSTIFHGKVNNREIEKKWQNGQPSAIRSRTIPLAS